MSKAAAAVAAAGEWREGRRQAARDTIVEAAWTAVREEGLASLSLRDLARRAGITTPTVYAYFDSKNAIYDAMFHQAAGDFAAVMVEPHDADDPHDVLVADLRRFVDFCTDDLARYQLLFQRTIPGFEPSATAYASAVRALAVTRERLARNRVTEAAHLDLWTALTTGLVDQQVSNDPGGDRWVRLIDDVVTMFLGFCEASTGRAKGPTRKKGPR